VLLSLGSWPGAELELSCGTGRWTGLSSGAGRLRARQVEVRAVGRGSAARSRQVALTLPGREPETPKPISSPVWLAEEVG
jgi:hypothetical protein